MGIGVVALFLTTAVHLLRKTNTREVAHTPRMARPLQECALAIGVSVLMAA